MTADSLPTYNVAQTLADMAHHIPYRPAIIFPAGRNRHGRAKFTQYSFQQLNQLCDQYAHGLTAYGIRPGDRTLLMIKPGVTLIAVTFALLKMGAVPVLIDPGMGRAAFLQCVAETEPQAFIGIPLAQAIRHLFPGPFQTIRHTITVGRAWGGTALDALRATHHQPFTPAATTTESEAAVTFTSGSTGLPKGVVYLHGMFRAQIDIFRHHVGIAEGEVDLPGLYIFALFNPALGVTTVIPDMDPRRPAQVNPAYLVEAIQTHGVTTSFGSPAIWQRVGHYCQQHRLTLPSLKRIFMASAPVPPSLVAQFNNLLPNGQVLTPFGATEALPITLLAGQELVTETALLSQQGHGVCVGRPIPPMTVRVIPLSDWAIEDWSETHELPPGDVGEIVVKGPVVTRQYLNRPYETVKAKIKEGADVWHRLGDIGYFDEQGRLWFCGRKSHRVETDAGLMLPVPCEAIFNQHPQVNRTALVGIGPRGQQRPVLIVEPKAGHTPTPTNAAGRALTAALRQLADQYEHTRPIKDILFHPRFPVDVRHNAKIQREKLAVWASKRL